MLVLYCYNNFKTSSLLGSGLEVLAYVWVDREALWEKPSQREISECVLRIQSIYFLSKKQKRKRSESNNSLNATPQY